MLIIAVMAIMNPVQVSGEDIVTMHLNWSNPDWLISDPHILDGMIEKDIRAVIDAKEELRRRHEIELVKGYQSDD